MSWSKHILLTNPFVAQRVSQLSGSYGKVITDKSLLNAEGLQLLGQQVTREANVLAYNDAFLVISVASAIGLVLLLGHLTWRRFVPHTAAAPAVATPS